MEVKINISEIIAVFVFCLKKYLTEKYHRTKYIILQSHVSSLILTTSGRVFYYLTTEPAKSIELRDFERNKRWGLLSLWSFVTCRHEGMMAKGKGHCHTSMPWNKTRHNKHAAQLTSCNAGHLFQKKRTAIGAPKSPFPGQPCSQCSWTRWTIRCE